MRFDWLIRFFIPSSENMLLAAAAGPAWRSDSSSFWGTLISVSSPRPFILNENSAPTSDFSIGARSWAAGPSAALPESESNSKVCPGP